MKTLVFFKISLLTLLLFSVFTCKKDDSKNDVRKTVHCSAGCSSMSWYITTEVGPTSSVSNCTRQYQGNSYIETCTGTITYEGSNHTYDFSVVYDWVNCDITVNVDGVGNCTDGKKKKKSTDCGCAVDETNAIVKYKEE